MCVVTFFENVAGGHYHRVGRRGVAQLADLSVAEHRIEEPGYGDGETGHLDRITDFEGFRRVALNQNAACGVADVGGAGTLAQDDHAANAGTLAEIGG